MEHFNFTTQTTNIQSSTNIPDYYQIHEVLFVDYNSGEILCKINYNWIKCKPVENIFKQYQSQHKPMDVIWDNQIVTQLFRAYQQNKNGVWVKRPYTPNYSENRTNSNDLNEIEKRVNELKSEIELALKKLEILKIKCPQYIIGTPEYEERMKKAEQ